MNQDKLEYYHCLNNPDNLARFFVRQQKEYLEVSRNLIFTNSELQLNINIEEEEEWEL